jgi:2-oxoisovalerate dehydrogenase E1 component beta subunit
MPQMTMVQAIQDALRVALREDPRVVVLGEDVGKNGGVFRVTEGLQAEFGEARVADTPLAENGIVGGAIGMALYGLKPVAEIQFIDFVYPAFDQIVSELAKMRWRSAGQYACPVVVRAPYGGGIKGGLYHSQSPEAYFCHTTGLTVVIPSTPADAKGLLLAALEGEDPVVFLEPKRLYRTVKEDVPEGRTRVPIGTARLAREGADVTVLAYGAMVPVAVEAAEQAVARGWSVEVVDLRTLLPLDTATMLDSVRKTGRVVILHEAPRTCGYGAELAAIVAEQALTSLQAPVLRVTGYDTPFPYSLEHSYLPDAPRVLRAIEHVMAY